VTVSVASNAPASVVNAVSASGGGSATANATDTTTITSGTGTGNGVATVTPSSFAFGGVQLGASVTQTFSLSNTGTGALGNIIISISSVASFGSLDYAITSNTCPASLAVNSAPCTFTVSFTPSIAAPDPGSVVITDDAAVGPTTVLLSGTGVASVYVLPFEVFYDGQTPGTTSPAQTATLFNVSDSPVGINGITFVGNAASDFSLVNNQCVNSLSSGSCTMGVTFKPSTTALGPRTADLTIATNATGGPFVSHLTGNGAIRHLPGFTANVLPPNDDQSTNEISLPFTLNFFGTNFSSLFVNNNGNVTFGQALSDFTPTGLTGNNGLIPIIAPYWADVDTTGAIPGIANPPSGVVTFGVDIVNGHQAFGVDYENVGYFVSHTDKLNSFQVILIDRSDTGVAGAFDIEFNYDKIQWEAGDASQGTAGLCTVASECAAVGYSNGTGTAGTNFQLNGSFAIGALLDNGPAATSLIHNSLNSTMLGRYEFQVRNGVVEPTLTVTETGAGTGTVVSSPAGINCPGTCSTSFVSGAQITLTPTAGANSTFTGWSGGTCEGTSPCTFTITASASVTANFGTGTGNNFALTVNEAGTGTGTVMSAPAGIICPTTCSANFASGQVVTLTATAADGSTFAGWNGAGCTGTGTCVVTVTAATAATATFNSGNSPVIISVASGSSSTVNTVPGGSGVFGLVLTGQTGFTGTVQLTCSSPIASITCNIVPSSVTLNGTTTNVAIVVNTFCKGLIPNVGPMPGGFGTGIGLLLVALSLCGAGWTFKKQPRWALSFGLLIIFGVGMSACSNLAKSPSGSATPPGSYPLVVTATPPSGAPSHVNLMLVVK
jgi:Nidogen-like/Divergent InlB B-repeat domain